jgi:ribosomal protein S6
MQEAKEDRLSIYEVSYLISANIPEEQVGGEAESIKKLIVDAGASIVAEEAPTKEDLAYTMRVKKTSGAYENNDKAYFGWVKFELASNKVEALKKKIESLPTVLRMLLITTIRENTYLGKRTSATAALAKETIPGTEDKKEVAAAPATVEEIDKGIDDLVKEV